jgi:hypothetical protein
MVEISPQRHVLRMEMSAVVLASSLVLRDELYAG